MKIPLDKVKVHETGYLEPGTYDARIFDVKYETVKDKEVMKITFKDAASGGTVQDTFWLTEAALWRVKKLAGACGFHSKEEQAGFDTEDLMGHSVQIKVVKDDKGYSRLADFIELPGAAVNDKTEKDQLIAELGKKSKVHDKKKAEEVFSDDPDQF